MEDHQKPFIYYYRCPKMDKESTGFPQNLPFLHLDEDLSLMERGQLKKSLSDLNKSKIEKILDPRLVTLVEFFRQLYIHTEEVFEKVLLPFPGLQEEFIETFRKISSLLLLSHTKSEKMKNKTIQRSLSVGSPRSISAKEQGDKIKLERFKVTTVKTQGDGSAGSGGQGGQTNTSS